MRVDRHDPVERREGQRQGEQEQAGRCDLRHAHADRRVAGLVLLDRLAAEVEREAAPDREVDDDADEEERRVEEPGLARDDGVVAGLALLDDGVRPVVVDVVEADDDRHEQQQHERQGAGHVLGHATDRHAPPGAGDVLDHREEQRAEADAEHAHVTDQVRERAVRAEQAEARQQRADREQPVLGRREVAVMDLRLNVRRELLQALRRLRSGGGGH